MLSSPSFHVVSVPLSATETLEPNVEIEKNLITACLVVFQLTKLGSFILLLINHCIKNQQKYPKEIQEEPTIQLSIANIIH